MKIVFQSHKKSDSSAKGKNTAHKQRSRAVITHPVHVICCNDEALIVKNGFQAMDFSVGLPTCTDGKLVQGSG